MQDIISENFKIKTIDIRRTSHIGLLGLSYVYSMIQWNIVKNEDSNCCLEVLIIDNKVTTYHSETLLILNFISILSRDIMSSRLSASMRNTKWNLTVWRIKKILKWKKLNFPFSSSLPKHNNTKKWNPNSNPCKNKWVLNNLSKAVEK